MSGSCEARDAGSCEACMQTCLCSHVYESLQENHRLTKKILLTSLHSWGDSCSTDAQCSETDFDLNLTILRFLVMVDFVLNIRSVSATWTNSEKKIM